MKYNDQSNIYDWKRGPTHVQRKVNTFVTRTHRCGRRMKNTATLFHYILWESKESF